MVSWSLFWPNSPQHIVIANRTVDKALQLAKGFAEFGYLLGCGFDMLGEQRFDLVINATSAGLQGELPPLPDTLIDTESTCAYRLLRYALLAPSLPPLCSGLSCVAAWLAMV